jgi:hypothetical protein
MLSKEDFLLIRQEKMKYTGTSVWQKVDALTGEVTEERTVDEFERSVGRNERFMITYLAEIICLIDSLGNQKMKVVKFILQNMSKADNLLLITTEELAKRTGVSKKTVIGTLKILDSAGIIHRRTGAIMVSPKLVNNKTSSGEATMMVKFRQFGNED